MSSPPYIDKCEGHLRRAVVGSQLIPDWEEASQRWSRVGTCQDRLDPGLPQLGRVPWHGWSPKSDVRQKVPRRQGPFTHYIVLHLNRKVPKLLDPWVPHPSSPHHVDHLNWIPMSPHQILFHSLDSHGSICLALSFLLFPLPKEAGANPHGSLLLHQLQELLLREG